MMPVPIDVKMQLFGRVAVCQLAGTLAGLACTVAVNGAWPGNTAAHASAHDFVALLLSGWLFGLPFYCAAVIVLMLFASGILRHRLAWCVALPALGLIASLIAFPPYRFGGIFWIPSIPLCALFTGILFVAWLNLTRAFDAYR